MKRLQYLHLAENEKVQEPEEMNGCTWLIPKFHNYWYFLFSINVWACAIRSDWAVFVLRVPSRACLLRVNLQLVLFASIGLKNVLLS